jgi:hypothetical protein
MRALDLFHTLKPSTYVERIPNAMTHDFILNRHYARRLPSISYAFGLFSDGQLEGICTYGTPSSSPLRTGICGKQYSHLVLELNRLFLLNNRRNDASRLIGASLNMLPKPRIIVSFADTEHGHSGGVYRATNFIYCGLSAKRTDWKIRGMEHLHGQTVADEFRGAPNRAAAMREKYGDAFYLAPRSRKHRYVYFIGSRKEVKTFRHALTWPVEQRQIAA